MQLQKCIHVAAEMHKCTYRHALMNAAAEMQKCRNAEMQRCNSRMQKCSCIIAAAVEMQLQ
jgi:hypothetical protein